MGRPESEEVNKGSATTDGGLCCWETAPSHFPLRIETLSPGLGGGQWGGEVGKVEGKQKDFSCRSASQLTVVALRLLCSLPQPCPVPGVCLSPTPPSQLPLVSSVWSLVLLPPQTTHPLLVVVFTLHSFSLSHLPPCRTSVFLLSGPLSDLPWRAREAQAIEEMREILLLGHLLLRLLWEAPGKMGSWGEASRDLCDLSLLHYDGLLMPFFRGGGTSLPIPKPPQSPLDREE